MSDFIPFYGWIIFHHMYISHFVYAFICWWTTGLFHLLAIVDNAAMHIGVQVYVWVPDFSSLGVYFAVELLTRTVILYLTFWGIVKPFFSVAARVDIPPAKYNGSNFSIRSPTLIFHFFDYRHPNECGVVSYCDFNLEKYLYFVHFWTVLFCCWIIVLYIFWILVPY